jgi:hypothetical protein
MKHDLIVVHVLYHDDSTKTVSVRREGRDVHKHYYVSIQSMVRLSLLLQGYINKGALSVRVWPNGWSVRLFTRG